ncbi:putative bifunctional diguanylate cyclase/phosphodiesterase [Govanella unica]|uniref:EAL domain-containing protein n=1 Tax=Govanella unica TaxID=2975056 RepID=A0A9X3TW47_9PROT|nr:EAL domain-containing protein [Govania unica]MDA5192639.1 EAL domain-containing protein [Govania unica]
MAQKLDLPRLKDRVTTLYSQTPAQVLTGLVTSLILLIFQNYLGISGLTGFAIAIAATQLLRLGPWIYFRRVPPRHGQRLWYSRAETFFLLCSALAALTIGLTAADILVLADRNSQFLVIFLMAPPLAISLTLAPASAHASSLNAMLILGVPALLHLLSPTPDLLQVEARLLVMMGLLLWVSFRLERQANALNETVRQCAELEAHLASQAYLANRTRETLQNVLGCVSFGIAIYDRHLHLTALNAAYVELFPQNSGLIREGARLEDVHRLLFQYHDPIDDLANHRILIFLKKISEEPTATDHRLEHTLVDGRIIHIHAQRMPDNGWVLTTMDMTSGRKAATEAMLHLSRHDSLTGLPNRTMIRRNLERNVTRASRPRDLVAVMLFNLSGFRSINDGFGTDIGDEILLNVAQRLNQNCDKSDTVGRLGGDEFAVISTVLSSPHAVEQQARVLANALRQPIEINGQKIDLGVAAGITIYPHDQSSPDELLRNAGHALNRARSADKNSIVLFDQGMQKELQARAALEIDIRANLDSHQFSFHYQPQIDLQSKQLVGVEALLRWNHPERGWVSPDQFIPVAEMSRLIIPLTERMLPEVCEQARIWDSRGLPPFKIAVNLSPIHIAEGSFPAFLRETLAAFNLRAERFEFEITETAIMGNSELAIESLREIEATGATLAVDDFGTGYASISYLRQFPVSKLKIDRSFVMELTLDPNARAIVAAVTRLGHSFGLKVVAEGVETEAQAQALTAIHCDMAQGYLFSRALTGDDLSRWAEERFVRSVVTNWTRPQSGTAE